MPSEPMEATRKNDLRTFRHTLHSLYRRASESKVDAHLDEHAKEI
jgi:hypothetical protein